MKIVFIGFTLGLILLVTGCAGLNGTGTTSGMNTQQKAAQVSVNLHAILADLTALEPVAGGLATGIEAAVAPELIPVTTAIAAAVNAANQAAVVAVPDNSAQPSSTVVTPPLAAPLPAAQTK